MKLAALIAKDLVFPLAGCEQASAVLGVSQGSRKMCTSLCGNEVPGRVLAAPAVDAASDGEVNARPGGHISARRAAATLLGGVPNSRSL